MSHCPLFMIEFNAAIRYFAFFHLHCNRASLNECFSVSVYAVPLYFVNRRRIIQAKVMKTHRFRFSPCCVADLAVEECRKPASF